MPQQPASRSTTDAPGMRDSSAFAGASRPIAFWWQWPWSRICRRPGAQRSAARPACHCVLEQVLEQHARARATALRLPLCVAAQQRRRVLAHRRQAARLEEDERARRAAASGYSRSVFDRGACARLVEQPLRDQRPAAADVRRERRRDARPLRARRAPAMPIAGIVVVRERVVEEQRPSARPASPDAPRRRANRRANVSRRPRRRHAPAIEAEQPFVQPADRRAAGRPSSRAAPAGCPSAPARGRGRATRARSGVPCRVQ